MTPQNIIELMDASDEVASLLGPRAAIICKAGALALDYPNVHVQPVFADFTHPFELPQHPLMPERNLNRQFPP